MKNNNEHFSINDLSFCGLNANEIILYIGGAGVILGVILGIIIIISKLFLDRNKKEIKEIKNNTVL